MPISSSPPGGPLPREFREAIVELAKQAREEDLKNEEEAKKRAARRPISRLIKIGSALVILEVISLAILYGQQRQQITTKHAPPSRILSRNDCSSAVYRTYWKVVAYIKDHGHPPGKLDDLLGKYLDAPPFDPATGKPLHYSTDGTHFDLSCAGRAPTRK